MQVRELMSSPVITADPEDTVRTAAGLLARYRIGALPVVGGNGRLRGMVTDRDLVIRCVAAGRDPGKARLRDIMTAGVCSVSGDSTVACAAHLMGRLQLRRLPVTEGGALTGMLSLGDLAKGSPADPADALWDRETDPERVLEKTRRTWAETGKNRTF